MSIRLKVILAPISHEGGCLFGFLGSWIEFYNGKWNLSGKARISSFSGVEMRSIFVVRRSGMAFSRPPYRRCWTVYSFTACVITGWVGQLGTSRRHT